jgi:hypothetical protein
LRARFPTDRRSYINDYDYADDSDLEEDDESDDEDDVLDDEPAPPVATETPRKNSDIVTVETSDARSNESLDIVSVSDLDSLFSEPPGTKGEAGTPSSAHVGKVVVIEDVAFVTYVGFLSFRCEALRLRVTDSRRCSGTCTRTRSSSRPGGPQKDAKPGVLRRYQNRAEFPNRHPNLSTDLPTR